VLLGAAPAYRGEPVQRYVNTVGAWLARHTERPDLEWRFAVLDSPGINAFAAPGGYVFVTRGLLAVLRGEAELAGVLAHEMAHVLAFHHLEAMTSRERFQLATDLALKASDLDGMLSDALVSMTREIYAKGLEQGDEFEADVMGVVIAARAGYDPYGLTQVLRTIDAASGDAAATGFFISTHPPVGERLQRLDATLQREFEIPGPPPSGSFRRMQAALGAR
jgi:predicted Zn-dependent protease